MSQVVHTRCFVEAERITGRLPGPRAGSLLHRTGEVDFGVSAYDFGFGVLTRNTRQLRYVPELRVVHAAML